MERSILILGPDTYVNLANQIIGEGLEQPTLEQTLSLLGAAWSAPSIPVNSDIIRKMRSAYFWGFNGALYLPGEGIITQERPKVYRDRVEMKKEDMMRKVEAHIGHSVGYVPFEDVKSGEHTTTDLIRNGVIRALLRKGGRGNLEKIAQAHRSPTKLSVLTETNKEVVGVVGIGSYLDRVNLDCTLSCNADAGYAFALLPSKEEKE